MKFLVFAVFMAILFQVNSAGKLRLITGLNGAVLTGGNPGLLLGGGVQPALLGGGLGVQPPFLGGGLIAQPQFGQVFPGVPYMVPPQYMAPPQAMLPFNPNLMAQQQQGGMPNWGLPAFRAQMGANQPQQQGAQGDVGNFNPQQGPALPGPVRRIKRSRVACTERPSIDSQISTQITPMPTAAEDSPSPDTV